MLDAKGGPSPHHNTEQDTLHTAAKENKMENVTQQSMVLYPNVSPAAGKTNRPLAKSNCLYALF